MENLIDFRLSDRAYEFMRLKDTYRILERNINRIGQIKVEKIGNGENFRISNLKTGMEVIKELSSISPIRKATEEITLHEDFKGMISDMAIVSAASGQFFAAKQAELYHKASLLFDVLRNQIFSEDRYDTFNILLPEMKTFSDFSEFFIKMEKVILTDLDDFEITGFDVGTKWINIFSATLMSAFIFIQIARQGFDLYVKDWHQAKALESVIRSLKAGEKAQEEYLRLIEENYKKSLDEKTKTAMDEIRKKHPEKFEGKKDTEINEYANRLKFAIDEMSKQISRGMEIYEAIEADKSYELPPLPNFREKNKLLKDAEQKLLEQKTDEIRKQDELLKEDEQKLLEEKTD